MLPYLPLANAGTPLMWLGCCWLVLGNLFVGLGEAWLLSRWRKAPVESWPIVFANYLAALGGVGLVKALGPVQAWVEQRPLERAGAVVVLGWVLAFFLSVTVEWPFVSWASRRRWFEPRALRDSLLLQLASYALLLLLAGSFGRTSALSLRNIPPDGMKTVPGWVYYLDPSAKRVLRTRLDGTRTESVAQVQSPTSDGWRRVSVERTKDGKWARLVLRSAGEGARSVVLRPHLGPAADAALPRNYDKDGFTWLGNVTFSVGSVPSFRSIRPDTYVGHWAAEGMAIRGKSFALETPFLAIPWRSATVLPDGKVVAQLGQAILLLDPEREEVAQLAQGSGPGVYIAR